jgi:RNA polymerase sigma factor (sigma-70 family)
MSSATTDDLAREASRGDERALEKIYHDYHQPLYRFCLAIVGNPQDAQDALQNTMVKMLRALPGEERSIALKPWLYRIAHNESIDLLRKRRPDIALEASEPQLGEELAVQVETRQRLRQLIADLSALPERQRETLLMREAAGLSFEEIGDALETSPAVARQTLYEARLGLRQMDAGREMECEAVTQALSDGDGRVRRRRDIRAHLRNCDPCRRFAEEIDSRSNTLAAVSPLPAVAAAALLRGLIGEGSAGGAAAGVGAGGGGGLVGGGAVKTVGTTTLLKGVATIAVVATIGAGAADRAGLVHIGGGNSGSRANAGAGTTRVESERPRASGGANPSSARSRAKSRATARSSLSKAALVRKGRTDRADGPDRGAPQSASGGEPTVGGPPPTSTAGSETNSAASGVKHPHGRRHIKQTPPAATHGQETAASHAPEKTKSPGASEPGSSKSAEHPAQPQPTRPEGSATTSPLPASAEPETKSPPEKPSK